MAAGSLESPAGQGQTGRRLRTMLDGVVAQQEGRTFLWSPVALVVGIWGYFALETEPARWAAMTAAGAGALLVWLGRRAPPLLLAGLVVMGFALAKLRADQTATPLLRATTGEVQVTGTVHKVDKTGQRRLVILLAPEAIEGLAPGELPRRLRLTSSEKQGAPPVGARVSLMARLSPNPSPAGPGGFDYGRRLWFNGIGGMGRVTSAPQVLAGSASWSAGLESWIQGVRDAMGARIRARLEEPVASFAEALMTGERATIPREHNESLLTSGLFHILSISGLHMWMVAGSAFWAVRAALALSPALAVGFPIRKWAAVVAVGMAWFYMLLADSGVATQRSFIMVAVVFFAVLVDRPALSARNLAIAALAVLVIEPEAAIEASFQMSFLAVLGLVTIHEAWVGWWRSRNPDRVPVGGWPLRLLRWMALSLLIGILTTLVAGTMSTIPAAYHFGRIAPYSILSNGLALPVIGILVMPAALLAAVLMPLGLEGPALWVMGKGLELVLMISHLVAAIPGAHVVTPQPPAAAAMLLGLGAVMTMLIAGPARLAGLPVMAVAIILAMAAPPGPDILIDRMASNVALRDEAGNLVPARPRRARFAVERWLRTNGERVTPAAAWRRPGWTCGADRCTAAVKGRRLVYVDAEGSTLDCRGIDILVATYPLRGACPGVPVRIDRFDVWRNGAHAIYLDGPRVRLVSARGQQGERPWVVEPRPRRQVTVAQP